MKLLLVSKTLFPYPGGSAEITENLARHFTPDELVVAGESRRFDGKAKRYERPSDWPRFYYIPSEISIGGRGRRFFNWLIWLQLPWIVYRLSRIMREEKITYVIGTFPTNYYLYAAYLAARRNRLPFSAYFHNTLVENRRGFNRWVARRIQEKVFASAEHIFVMSDGMADYYRRHYPGIHKFAPLVHTFSEYPAVVPSPWRKKKVYDLVLIGNVNASNAEATVRFLTAVSRDARFRVNLYTHVPDLLLRQRGLDPNTYVHRGFVPAAEVVERLWGNDIVVLTHGFEGAYDRIEYETIFPTRTIPLLLSGRPLFAHAPDFAFITRVLARHDAAEIVTTKREADIIQGLERIIEDDKRRAALIRNGQAMVAGYFGPRVVNELKEKLIGREENA